MDLPKLQNDERAVSPVVGVALLIAITVILAAVIGGVVLGLGTSSVDAPQASLQFEYNDTADELTVSHKGGEKLKSDNLAVRGNATFTFSSDLAAGQSRTIPATLSDGDEVSIVWQDPNSNEEAVIGTFEYSG
jgi:flagellin-like protein